MKINYSFKGRFGFDNNQDTGAKSVKGFKKFFNKKEEAETDDKPSVKSESNFKNNTLGFGGHWLLSGSVELTVDELKELDREYREQIKNGDVLETAKQTGAGIKEVFSAVCESCVENATPIYDKIAELRERYEEDDHASSVKMAERNAELSELTHNQRMTEKKYAAEERKLDKQLDKAEAEE